MEIDLENNYLKKELYDLVQKDPQIFDFIQEAILDGVWYWDLENPENEWMSPKFWKLFGYDSSEKQHLRAELKKMIHPRDLAVATKNLKIHLKNPMYPYDQIVRYTHKDGSTMWVRCRGFALFNDEGKAIRVIGAHTDVTTIMNKQQLLIRAKLENTQLSKELKKKILSLKELEQRYEFLEHKFYGLPIKNEITSLYEVYGLYEVAVPLVQSAIRLGLVVNTVTFRIENANYIKEHFTHNELLVKCSKLKHIFQKSFRDMLFAKMDDDLILGISVGYDENHIEMLVNDVKQNIAEFKWSLIAPTITIKSAEKENLQEFSKEIFESWIIELG